MSGNLKRIKWQKQGAEWFSYHRFGTLRIGEHEGVFFAQIKWLENDLQITSDFKSFKPAEKAIREELQQIADELVSVATSRATGGEL